MCNVYKEISFALKLLSISHFNASFLLAMEWIEVWVELSPDRTHTHTQWSTRYCHLQDWLQSIFTVSQLRPSQAQQVKMPLFWSTKHPRSQRAPRQNRKGFKLSNNQYMKWSDGPVGMQISMSSSKETGAWEEASVVLCLSCDDEVA